ncbi:hypothetical protein OV207_23100 [Corallococcus sp. BB11-1]|uniref:ATP-grasp domain-containing protein n=1 Tax=Corallococcus sp. BB11-1 TaxID=2996783 RepID=UPI00226E445F|nr:hypothetical protein [Corallococcus sp. BB11-1]MCY1034359.1 hypothetical protein [Corallococcus sp. BB11-1]
MILLVGALANPALAFLTERLLSSGADVLLLDARQYPEGFGPVWSPGAPGEGRLRCGQREVAHAELTSVYLHQLDEVLGAWRPAGVPEGDPREAGLAALAAWADSLPGLVVNRPEPCRSNASKPYQQMIAARHGFRVPDTLITSVPEDARRFIEQHDGRVIYKSQGPERSVVRRVSSEDLGRLDMLRHCPVMFQEQVPGTDVRVHVVGTRVFVTELRSGATDYRFAEAEGHTCTLREASLPPADLERCLALSQALGMVVSGIDLRRTPDGELCCFEVNPAPGFTFYQSATGQPIGEALADLLLSGRP